MPAEIPPLVRGNFYHIYNRGNNKENVFVQERNYPYFMDLWWKHISPIAETWSYCLLRNHFHATVCIKENLSGLIMDSANQNPRENLSGFKDDLVNKNLRQNIDTSSTGTDGNLTGFNKTKDPSQYFSNFFNAYSRAFNIATQREGALFARPFKRIPVDSESYLMRLIVYVHQNPQKHQFVTDFRDWNYSSYHALIGNAPTRLPKEKVLQLFGSREDFIRIHQEIQPLENFEDED